MKKWNKMRSIPVCLSLLFMCSACTAEADLMPAPTAVALDGQSRNALHAAAQARGDSLYGITEIELACGEAYSLPCAVIQNAAGEELVLEHEKAHGTMELIDFGSVGLPTPIFWRYSVPSSEQYVIVPDPQQDKFYCSLTGRLLSSEINQFFDISAAGIEQVKYSHEKILLLGNGMEYTLSICPNLNELSWGKLFFTGNGETRVMIQYDGNDLLVGGTSADCEVTASLQHESNRNPEAVSLGVCPAGKWTRLSYDGTNWVLTVEPSSPWPWVALGGGVLLLIAASLLLLRKKRVKPPSLEPVWRFPESPPET